MKLGRFVCFCYFSLTHFNSFIYLLLWHYLYAVGTVESFIYLLLWHYLYAVGTVESQRVLVICCSDNEKHIMVVKKFLKFLEAKCNVHVVIVDNNCTMSAESVQDWLLEEIKLAVKVVLVHSEESVAMAWHFTRLAVTRSVALKTFITALEMFAHSRVDQSKLLNVYFSYTPSNCVVEINCGHTYQLMGEFDNFLTNVRGSSGFNSSSLLACNEGNALQWAINEAAAYAEVHPPDYGFLPPDTDSIDTESIISRIAADVGSNVSDIGVT